MKPLSARVVGAGGAMLLALGISMTAFQQRAEANAPVCFTVTGGDCYCIDFFYTEVKEQLISQAQQYINNLMEEHNILKEMGVGEAISGLIGNARTYDGYLDGDHRQVFDAPASERPLPEVDGIPAGTRDALERDPEGETSMGRQARAVATAAASPETLAPYQVTRGQSGGVDADGVLDWTDRMLLAPAKPHIPNDEGLAALGVGELLALYEEARHYLGANYARHHMIELAASEQRLQSLEASRESLELGQLDQAGAVQSANLVAKTVNLAIDAELLESQLRREALTASLIAMRIGGAYEE